MFPLYYVDRFKYSITDWCVTRREINQAMFNLKLKYHNIFIIYATQWYHNRKSDITIKWNCLHDKRC